MNWLKRLFTKRRNLKEHDIAIYKTDPITGKLLQVEYPLMPKRMCIKDGPKEGKYIVIGSSNTNELACLKCCFHTITISGDISCTVPDVSIGQTYHIRLCTSLMPTMNVYLVSEDTTLEDL